jgi:hypothetical protein
VPLEGRDPSALGEIPLGHLAILGASKGEATICGKTGGSN